MSVDYFGHYPQGVDDAGNPEENEQDDVNQEVFADAAFKHNRYRWKENRQDNHQDFVIARSHSTNLLKSSS